MVLVHFFSIPAYDWAGLMYLKLQKLQAPQGLQYGILYEAGDYSVRKGTSQPQLAHLVVFTLLPITSNRKATGSMTITAA
ncbi:hypothetical protein [uncultured Oxalicibacterium sp.]|uniref:hypothetical protein n=1 Tax=uncultured Oxalicibacterium sp. TaxID=1168540 RepID=UPI0025D7DA40|nr:hypothetical protein [uncultured Oxalicibacterium sp.]